MSARTKAYIEMLVVAAIWGAAGPIIKYTLGGFTTTVFLTYRFAISTLVAVFLFLFLKMHLPKDRSDLISLLVYGFLTSTVSLGFLFFGLENTTVLDMTLITLANPLLVSVAGVYFLGEHITKREKFGIGIALLGTLMTVVEPLIQNGHQAVRLSGNIFIVGYLIANAWATVIAKKLLRNGVSPLLMTGVSFIIGFISFLPFAFFANHGPLLSIHYSYHLGVFYMALISGSLAYYLYEKSQKTIEIGEASIFSYLNPIFSTPLAIFWLQEKITTTFVIGAVVIALGVAIAEIKKQKN